MSRRTVLVVEDSEVEAQVLQRSLSGMVPLNSIVLVNSTTDAETYIFSESALAGGSRPTPDLVLLDVKVPPAGGVDFLRKLRSDNRTRTIPVVMVSGQMRDQDVQELYRSGANSYLDKPVDGQEFLKVISATARYWLSLNLSAASRG